MPRSAPAWLKILVLSLCGMVSALQFTLVIPLLPAFPELLDISASDSSWLVTATLLTAAVGTPIIARMADMYGKRRMLLVALGAMILGSVICALEVSFLTMIVGRALQGFGASLIAVGISILRDELPPKRIGTAVALMSATMGIGSALGLPLAGVLSDVFGWHSIFWFGAVAGAALVVSLLVVVDESPVRTPGRFDVGGALLLSAALVCLLLPISKGSVWGWGEPVVLVLLASSVALLAVWIPVELRINQPMVDLRTSARRPVLVTNIASIFAGMAMFVNMLVTVQVLQQPVESGVGFGLDVTSAGLAMVPSGLAMVAISPISGWLLGRFGGRLVLLVGSALMAFTYIGRVFYADSVAAVVIGSTLVGIGTALAFAAMPTLIMSSVPITETASANGLNSLVRSIGTSLASTVVAAIMATYTIEAGGMSFASQQAFHAVLWLGALAAGICTGLATLIPRDRRTHQEQELARAQGREKQEAVVRGRITLARADGSARGTILVSVLDAHGEQLDWSRADNDGRYSVVLPGPGTYVVIANAVGWAPAAEVFEFSGGEVEQHLTFSEELTVSGTVTRKGMPAAGALVALSEAVGKQVGATRCDGEGRYVFQLPPTGRYVLTAYDPHTGQARARKVLLTLDSEVVDIDIAAASPARQPLPER
ncbi:MFS transporter [Aeromicrobium camelliae]|uniref:MFS transporter n=1 Tax=Aeromicrobium camelliae TaxID=1538144 RepID=A0A3N6WRF9_9ACTN|nr:MFS transporter [Aeromicrobium camelliae]RQN10056.1 MFS transporter [Aeromicrobium camelliae]